MEQTRPLARVIGARRLRDEERRARAVTLNARFAFGGNGKMNAIRTYTANCKYIVPTVYDFLHFEPLFARALVSVGNSVTNACAYI